MGKVGYLSISILILFFLFYGCSKRTSSTSTTSTVTLKGKVNIPNATIYISSIDSEGKLIKKVEVKTKGGKFEAQVPYSDKGGSFVFVADGGKDYIRATKTVKYKKYEDVDGIEVNLELLRVNAMQINVKDGLTITDTGKKYVRIRLDKGGVRGANEYKGKLIELNIPLELIKAQDTIEVRYRSFTPSDPQDYRFFPGEENERGERLLSVGFDYIDIVNPVTNKTVFDKSIIKQNQEVIRMLRWVDKEQLVKIKSRKGSVDEDPSKGGIQVTFYAFDSDKGAWVVAGKGVFVNSGSVNYTSQAFDNILQNGCADQQECDNNGVYWNEDDMFLPSAEVYAVVSITNPDLRWKNLDYIAPGDPAECEIVITDSKGNPVGTWVEASPDETGNIEYTYGFTSPSTGRTVLRTITYGSPENGKISYYNPKNGWVISPICRETASPIVKFVKGCRCTINIDYEKVCEVKGRVTDRDGNPLSGVTLEISGFGFSSFAFTDSNGNYSAKVPCNKDLSIYAYNYMDTFVFNVNGVVGGDESSDDGTTAVVNITLGTCYAEGRILFEGNPIGGVLVASTLGNVLTGVGGEFKIRIKCDTSEQLYLIKDENTGPCNCKVATYLSVYANGKVDMDEVFDDGVTVRVGDFELAPCFVRGRFTDTLVQNKDLVGASVYVETIMSIYQDYRNYRSFMETDSSGAYRLPILCELDSRIIMSYGLGTGDPDIRYMDEFRVDGSVGGSEVSDDGKTVNMGTVDVAECKVSGSVTDQSSQPVGGATIELINGSSVSALISCSIYPCMSYSDITDNSGNYTLGTLCSRGGVINTLSISCTPSSPASFNVNGTVESPENGDDGTTVTLNFTNCQRN